MNSWAAITREKDCGLQWDVFVLYLFCIQIVQAKQYKIIYVWYKTVKLARFTSNHLLILCLVRNLGEGMGKGGMDVVTEYSHENSKLW